MQKPFLVLALATAGLVFPAPGQALSQSVVPRDCSISSDKPIRDSRLQQIYRPQGNEYYMTSSTVIYGKTKGSAPFERPLMRTYIHSRAPDKYSTGATWNGMYLGQFRFEVEMPEDYLSAIVDGDDPFAEQEYTMDLSIDGRVVYKIPERRFELNSGIFWGTIREDENRPFAAVLDRWSDTKPLVVTVRSLKDIVTSVEFAKSDFTSLTQLARADWLLLEKAYRTGVCAKRTSY